MHAVNTGDTAWLLTSSALVLFMTPGLALFYGGMVRAKNVLSTLMYSFICMGRRHDPVGAARLHARVRARHRRRDRRARLRRHAQRLRHGQRAWRPPFRHAVFVAYQCMFAIIAPALITGAFAERMKFSAWMALHRGVDAARLLADGALGVGRRLAAAARRHRLRRRDRHPPDLGGRGARVRARDRQAHRATVPRTTTRTTCR